MSISGRSERFGGRIRLGMVGGGQGVKGVAFVDACVRSSKRNAAWVRLAG